MSLASKIVFTSAFGIVAYSYYYVCKFGRGYGLSPDLNRHTKVLTVCGIGIIFSYFIGILFT